MIFETLYPSAQRGELMLVDGGMCHWHLRRDGQLTIREIISTRPGAGSLMLRRLAYTPGATSLFAKCPFDLPANRWYLRRGFRVVGNERTKQGRLLVHWRRDISHAPRVPNVGGLEVIYCANGNQRKAEIAIDAGMIYGAQLPGTVYFRPYMTDQDWKSPDRAKYMAALEQYRPHIATVLDWERPEQWGEVLSWAEEAAQYAKVIVIIPKVLGTIPQIPSQIGGVPVRLGYSVPTKKGRTELPLSQFAGWGGGVHLLGGSPEKQMEIYRQIGNVRSVDCNMHSLHSGGGRFWVAQPRQGVNNKHWPTLAESGEPQPVDGHIEAFRRSCVNIMQAWREVVSAPPLPLFENARLAVTA